MLRDGEIVAHRIWKRFRPDMQQRRLSAHLLSLPQRLRGKRDAWMWALRDVDFKIAPGESVGLVGANGSGKSTLLKILNRVMYPYAGHVEVAGRTGALIEITTGLHPELTGRENVLLYGTLLGLRRKDVVARFDAIVDFAEIAPAIDRQLKFYSSGMRMRLGFAVAAFLEPAILLVDEVLAVGDARFQQRCLDRMSEVHRQGTTVFYVSHDLQTVEATCNRAIWLHNGVVTSDGPVNDVLAAYRGAVERQEELTVGEGSVRVVDVEVHAPGDAPPETIKPLEIELTLDAPEAGPAIVHLGVTQGTATPLVLVSHQRDLERGKNRIKCTLESLPVPRGRYYLWLSINAPGTRVGRLFPWNPVRPFDVEGPGLDPAPPGVVRLGPVYVDSEWDSS
jgi:ABC-type polysaccharide/polyol phosphate transport system ATPase subunit